jgi:hypothetical protein
MKTAMTIKEMEHMQMYASSIGHVITASPFAANVFNVTERMGNEVIDKKKIEIIDYLENVVGNIPAEII